MQGAPQAHSASPQKVHLRLGYDAAAGAWRLKEVQSASAELLRHLQLCLSTHAAQQSPAAATEHEQAEHPAEEGQDRQPDDRAPEALTAAPVHPGQAEGASASGARTAAPQSSQPGAGLESPAAMSAEAHWHADCPRQSASAASVRQAQAQEEQAQEQLDDRTESEAANTTLASHGITGTDKARAAGPAPECDAQDTIDIIMPDATEGTALFAGPCSEQLSPDLPHAMPHSPASILRHEQSASMAHYAMGAEPAPDVTLHELQHCSDVVQSVLLSLTPQKQPPQLPAEGTAHNLQQSTATATLAPTSCNEQGGSAQADCAQRLAHSAKSALFAFDCSLADSALDGAQRMLCTPASSSRNRPASPWCATSSAASPAVRPGSSAAPLSASKAALSESPHRRYPPWVPTATLQLGTASQQAARAHAVEQTPPAKRAGVRFARRAQAHRSPSQEAVHGSPCTPAQRTACASSSPLALQCSEPGKPAAGQHEQQASQAPECQHAHQRGSPAAASESSEGTMHLPPGHQIWRKDALQEALAQVSKHLGSREAASYCRRAGHLSHHLSRSPCTTDGDRHARSQHRAPQAAQHKHSPATPHQQQTGAKSPAQIAPFEAATQLLKQHEQGLPWADEPGVYQLKMAAAHQAQARAAAAQRRTALQAEHVRSPAHLASRCGLT